MYGSNYSSYASAATAIALTSMIVPVIVGLIVACICGAISKSINERKGYDGGFAWGFWLGVIGIIIVACRADAYIPTQTYSHSSSNDSGYWRCRCGRENARFVSTCSCGLTKAVATAPTANTATSESGKIEALKEYKSLLESGTITQEEFDAKKKELLS